MLRLFQDLNGCLIRMKLEGYGGEVLKIDLSKGEAKKESLDERLARDYLGGRGFVAKTLWDRLPRGLDPLSDQNILVVAPGVLSGHLGPAPNRITFGCKSPLTGGYGDSTMGGYFSPELKAAGYDMIVFTGASGKPVFLYVHDSKVELRDASEYWGKGAIETERLIKARYGEKFQVAAIGPAGENLVKFACVTHHTGRNAGRTGVGCVMGSKKLKAIAVRGTGKPEPYNPKLLGELSEKATKDMISNPFFEQFKKYGTNVVTELCNEWGVLPNRNFRRGTYEHWNKLAGEAQRSRIVRDLTCWGCPIACYMEVKMEKYGNMNVHFSEYETTAMIGTNLELEDVDDLLYANYLCNDLGVDTMTTGSVIGFAIECYERGVINDKDTGGLKLRFGDTPLVHKLIRMIAYREGLGDLLAEGTRRLTEIWKKGSEEYAMQVKGMETSAYDSRAAPAMLLSFMTCDVGAHHNRSWAITHDIKMGREKMEGKAETVVALQNKRPVFDQLGVCRFPWVELNLDFDYYAKFYNAITGDSKSTEDLLKIGEKVWNLTRSFWVREIEDFGRKYDMPPRRWLSPIQEKDDPTKGFHVTEEDINRLLDRYYELRGWSGDGRPTKEKLDELGLGDVAQELVRLGRI